MDITSMRPITIVHSGKDNSFSHALHSSQHHVGGVDGMHEVWRESRVLLLLVYRLLVSVFSDCDVLDYCLDHVFLRYVFVRLDAREAKGSDPLDRITGACDDFCAFRKPFLDLVCITKEISNALNCYLS